jgi:hypothetical protein
MTPVEQLLRTAGDVVIGILVSERQIGLSARPVQRRQIRHLQRGNSGDAPPAQRGHQRVRIGAVAIDHGIEAGEQTKRALMLARRHPARIMGAHEALIRIPFPDFRVAQKIQAVERVHNLIDRTAGLTGKYEQMCRPPASFQQPGQIVGGFLDPTEVGQRKQKTDLPFAVLP